MQNTYLIRRGHYCAVIADLAPPGEFSPNTWNINRINALPPFRGQGLGREILNQILTDADTEQVTLTLEPRAYRPDSTNLHDGLTQSDLEAWYLRHGFAWTSAGYMIREPYPRHA